MATFAYIDETGTSSLDDSDQPIVTLVAALVDESEVQPLAESFRSLAMHALPVRPHDFEFKGYEIFHQGEGPWANLTADQRVDVYARALALLEQHDVKVAHASINKPRLAAKYASPFSPYLLGLQFLCQKLDEIWPEQLKVLVADEKKEHEYRAIDMVADMQLWGYGVVGGNQLTTVIDSLHFVDSRKSPGVQMADLVAFILQRHRGVPERDSRAARAMDRLMWRVRHATVTYRDEWP